MAITPSSFQKKDNQFSKNPMPLMCWDVFFQSFDKKSADAKRNNDLEKILLFEQQFKWKTDISKIFSENDYEAIILTDENQKIIWVNDGFKLMTGYDKTFAVNKTPRFLQGEQTRPATRNRIRNKIDSKKPFEDIITNHRKDSTTYKCEVKIYPLQTETTTHFIAFEKELRD